jgi:uncharacterized membrane protein
MPKPKSNNNNRKKEPKIISDNFNKNHALPRVQRGGRVQKKWNTIEWTSKKKAVAILGLGGPYLIAILLTFAAGMTVIGCLLIGVALLAGLLVWFLRWWSTSEF